MAKGRVGDTALRRMSETAKGRLGDALGGRPLGTNWDSGYISPIGLIGPIRYYSQRAPLRRVAASPRPPFAIRRHVHARFLLGTTASTNRPPSNTAPPIP